MLLKASEDSRQGKLSFRLDRLAVASAVSADRRVLRWGQRTLQFRDRPTLRQGYGVASRCQPQQGWALL